MSLNLSLVTFQGLLLTFFTCNFHNCFSDFTINFSAFLFGLYIVFREILNFKANFKRTKFLLLIVNLRIVVKFIRSQELKQICRNVPLQGIDFLMISKII